MEQNHSTIKTFMAIMAERDAAIRERNIALEERKRAFAERDMAMLQRDAALAEHNSAIQERDEAIAILQFRSSSMNDNDIAPDFPGNDDVRGVKKIHHDQQMHHMFDLAEAKYSPREIPTSNALEITGVPLENTKAQEGQSNKGEQSIFTKASKVAKGREKRC